MPLLFSTVENLSHLKSASRQILPTVKSAHLTEAIAAGMGFRTNASLLAAMKSERPNRPALIDFRQFAMSQRLDELGYANTNSIKLDWEYLVETMPDKIWLRFKNKDLARNNYWFYECRDRGIPNVFIEQRRKLVEVHWDCISIDSAEESHVQGKPGSALMREMFDAYQVIARRSPARSLFFGSSFVGSVDHLPTSLAADMADMLFKKLYDPLYRNSGLKMAS